MNIIHIMKDGTVKTSIEGTVITSKEFYEVLNAIQQKRRKMRNENSTDTKAAN